MNLSILMHLFIILICRLTAISCLLALAEILADAFSFKKFLILSLICIHDCTVKRYTHAHARN